MNYLARPILQSPIDWSDPVNKQFTFDLREVALGFGSEIFTSLQQYVVQGYDLTVDLPAESDVQAFDDFIAGLYGRLIGFWLPAPFDACQLHAGVSNTQFDIVDQGLANTWNDHPDIHLYFTRDGFNPQAAKITAVANLGNGFERVTINTALADWANLFAPGSMVRRLHYVRLADDEERGTFTAEGWLTRHLRVLELPTEYTVVETGQKKIILYHFWCEAPMDVHWYFTSFAGNVISQNVTYLASSINHGSFTRALTGDVEKLEIDAASDPNHPFALFLPIPFPRIMNVQISETTLDAPDVATLYFTGEVRSVNDNGDSLAAQCESFSSIASRKLPRMTVKPTCNYMVYEPSTCKVVRARFETTAAIAALSMNDLPPSLAVTLLFPKDAMKDDDWFAQGWIEVGADQSFEVRTILSSTYDAGTDRVTLQLNAPLFHALVGEGLQLIPGCDGTPDACGDDKFKNFKNFGGFLAVPKTNPSLQAINANAAAGGKK